MTRLSFGVAPSGFLAQRTLLKLVEDHGADYPLASDWVVKQRYVDDLISCFNSINEARAAQSELIDLMSQAGLEVRKFVSSEVRVMHDLPAEFCEDVDLANDNANVKVLGLRWSPAADAFRYSVDSFSGRCTKRQVLSYAARIFDVKGFLSPITIYIKCFLKRLWDLELSWDAEFGGPLAVEWMDFTASMLLSVPLISVPRYVPVFENLAMDIVGFSDASAVAHAACIYVRIVKGSSAELHLLRGKARVNSARPKLTIPRAELQGAKLLVDLYQLMLARMTFPVSNVYFLTDSMIVLGWLRTSTPSRLQLFVENRVSYILTHTKVEQWRHVPSEMNCADVASRGCSATDLLKEELWWEGSPFLRNEPIVWPASAPVIEELPECKVLLAQVAAPTPDLTDKCSSLSRLKRIYAFVLRFARNFAARQRAKLHPELAPIHEVSGPLTRDELNASLNYLIGQVQRHHFPELFVAGAALPKKLRKLTPFIDHNTGTARVGGRLSAAPLPYTARHPQIIPKDSNLARLLVSDAHDRTVHGGNNVMKTLLYRNYFVFGMDRLVKDHIHRCMSCIRYRHKPVVPQMADLPATRFESVRCFHLCASDFAGPYLVHEGTRSRARLIKAWICLFTCMSTRAVHFEVVHELSSQAFMAAVDRMVARRGKMSLIYSDNGTNYKGACRLLLEVRDLLRKGNDIARLCADRQIEFTFVSPLSPWKNGICESLVKVLKSHIVGPVSHLTYVEFETLVVRIEGIVNSRPLIPLTVDRQEVLTPGHFLVGDHLAVVPELDLDGVSLSHLDRWQVISHAVQHFWKKWRDMYLHTLLPRIKWQAHVPNLSEGNLVIIRNENTPPGLWNMGIVIEVLPAKDGIVRTVRVRTSAGCLVRPVARLIPCPI